jgi:hypothetical protein
VCTASSANAVCGGGSVKSVNIVCGGGSVVKCEQVCGGGDGANGVDTVCDCALNLVTKPIGGSINMELRTIHYTLWR